MGLVRTNLKLVSFSPSWRSASSKQECAEQAERSFGRAKCRYEATRQLLNRVETDRNEVEKKIESLGEKLAFLRKELDQAA